MDVHASGTGDALEYPHRCHPAPMALPCEKPAQFPASFPILL